MGDDRTSREFGSDPAPMRAMVETTAPRQRLSVERIVDVAIAQMRSEGYDCVTMRSIARHFETGPASLYAHVANRDHLDQLVVGRIVEALEVPEPDPEQWDDQLKALLRQHLALLRAHPGAARASLAMMPTEYGTLRATEAILAYCRAGRVDDQSAAWFCDIATLYVASTAAEESMWIERGKTAERSGATPVSEEQQVAFVRDHVALLPDDEFPIVRSMAADLTNGDRGERFEFGLDVLVAGLKARSRS